MGLKEKLEWENTICRLETFMRSLEHPQVSIFKSPFFPSPTRATHGHPSTFSPITVLLSVIRSPTRKPELLGLLDDILVVQFRSSLRCGDARSDLNEDLFQVRSLDRREEFQGETRLLA
jgi:hypothetical protein